ADGPNAGRRGRRSHFGSAHSRARCSARNRERSDAGADCDKRDSDHGCGRGKIVIAKSFLFLVGAATIAFAADSRLVSLRIEPESRVLQNAGSHQQLLAIATYADGGTRDLTAVAKWSLSDPSLASLDQNGVLSSRADGKVAAVAVVDGTRAE